MNLISLVVVLIVVGVLLWLVQSVIPMAEPMRKIITVVVVVACVLWLLSAFFGPITYGPVFRVR